MSVATFGFEAEFRSRVDSVIYQLHEAGVAGGATERHRYHCDCDDCTSVGLDDGGPLFRAQTDSSCGGEIISRVLRDDDWSEAIEAFTYLATAAGDDPELGARAGIGPNCGFHVHVALGEDDDPMQPIHPVTFTQNGDIAYAFLGIERWVNSVIGAGAYSAKRDSNATLLESVVRYVRAQVFEERPGVAPILSLLSRHTMRNQRDRSGTYLPPTLWERGAGADEQSSVALVIAYSIAADRHCDLNFSSSHGTTEIRVFNATRSAWRMEMNCRFAAWFARNAPMLASQTRVIYPTWTEVAEGFAEDGTERNATLPPIMSWGDLVSLIGETDERLAELVTQQRDYLDGKYGTPLSLEDVIDA